jgi:hypothetical protein
MNGHLDSMNLFKGYSQEENAQTHAFLAFLNFLRHANARVFRAYWHSLGFNPHGVSPADIEIGCLTQKDGGTWDGQILSQKSRWFIAVESKVNKGAFSRIQLSRHKRHIKSLAGKRGYRRAKLVLLTPFDKDWIVKEYLRGKREPAISFLSWGDIYKSTLEIRGKVDNRGQKFVVNQYVTYLEAANEDRAGIIQILSNKYISDEVTRRFQSGEYVGFHIPSKKIGFDLPNFKVFCYNHEKNGISWYFTSKGLHLDRIRLRGADFKHYFEVDNPVTLKNPITVEMIRRLLGKREMGGNYHAYRDFKKRSCPAPYYLLNRKMVNALVDEAGRCC